MRPHPELWLSSVTDCKLRYTADMPPHAHGAALCCCWLLGCGRVAALYDNNSCLFVARSQICVSSNNDTVGIISIWQVIMQVITLIWLVLGVLARQKKTPWSEQFAPISCPGATKHVPSYIIQRPCSNKEKNAFRFGDAVSLEQLNNYTIFLRMNVTGG